MGEVIVRKILGICVLFLLLTGCASSREATEKVRDIDYTVVPQEEVPEELFAKIQEKKEGPMRLTYTDGAYLYVAEGYGCKQSGGYSVTVEACYETRNGVYIKTRLLGPTKEEAREVAETFPYVVIKMEQIDKHVVFQ